MAESYHSKITKAALFAFTAASLLASSVAAQGYDRSGVKLIDRVFLAATQPEAGQIEYVEIYEHLGKKDYLMEDGQWRPLITGLIYPTHMAYDFEKEMLYICDCDKIKQYNIGF